MANVPTIFELCRPRHMTLRERIGMFEDVVGPLQPILAEMPRIFRNFALGEIERAEALRQLDEAKQRRPPAVADALDQMAGDEGTTPDRHDDPRPATQDELARWCLIHPAPGIRIRTIPEPGAASVTGDCTKSCLAITWPYAPGHLGVDGIEEVHATFDGSIADRHPPTGPVEDEAGVEHPGREGVRLLTWGAPYLAAWLEAVRGEPLTDAYLTAAQSNPGEWAPTPM
jgi:hypothetical protein